MPRRPALRVPRAVLAPLLLCVACSPVDPPPNVLLVTVDTLRADHVGSYGAAAGLTPNIDALAARGALFETAIAASSATVPSHASIMASRFVREHSVGHENGPTRLEGLETLADRFREAGYDTAAFVSNVVLKRRSGLDRGFAHYDDELPRAERNRPGYFERRADETVARALAWLAAPRSGPVFLWLHVQDPHGPYTPPPPGDGVAYGASLRTDRPLGVMQGNRGRGGIPAYQELEALRRPSEYARRYAGEVHYADRWIGELIDRFERQSTGRGAIVLLTADHGESLDENGFFFQHGHATTPEQARVPFVVVAPDLAPSRRSELVGHVDVAPTLLELAGLPPLVGASGISLVPMLRQGAEPPERLLFCDIGREASAYGRDGLLRVTGWPDQPAWASRDASDAEARRALERYLESAMSPAPAAAMSDEDLARLRALGYLEPEASP